MNHTSRVLVAASMSLALATGAAVAQPAPAASAPMGASPMHDCKAMHEKGSEKSMPMGKPMKCAMGSDGAASAPAKKAKPNHDHSTSPKNPD